MLSWLRIGLKHQGIIQVSYSQYEFSMKEVNPSTSSLWRRLIPTLEASAKMR